MDSSDNSIADMLSRGEVGIIPTDTLYGLVGSAQNQDAVERIYKLKKRDKNKPLIVLISNMEELERFGVVLSDRLRNQLSAYWPGPYSIILPVIDEQFEYLHRGTDSIAFRVPDKPDLLELLQEAGALVAPSANIEGSPPAETADAARRYFGDDVYFYIDGGELHGKPSVILKLHDDNEFTTVRD